MDSVSDFKSDTSLAKFLAQKAGEILLDLREKNIFKGEKLGKQGDKEANDFIIRMLLQYRPEDGILSEETFDDLTRLRKQRVWIIDPLDGTREYSELRDDWAVHIGLCIEKKPVLGAVSLPSLGQVFESDFPIEKKEIKSPLRILVSRTRPCKEAYKLAEKLNGILIPMGSAGAKAMAIIKGEADIYIHSGGQHEWDNCAPIAIALANGFHASRIDGSEIQYNNQNTLVSDLLICQKQIANMVLETIKT